MKKRFLLSGVGAVGAGVAGFVLKDKDKRDKLKTTVKNTTLKIKNMNKETTLEDAGIPDQVEKKDQAQFENSKMVSEGSQFGVNYYNEAKEEKEKEEAPTK